MASLPPRRRVPRRPRGLPLRAGMIVTTGAATGIHDIIAGQVASIRFDGLGEIRCRAVPAPVRS